MVQQAFSSIRWLHGCLMGNGGMLSLHMWCSFLNECLLWRMSAAWRIFSRWNLTALNKVFSVFSVQYCAPPERHRKEDQHVQIQSHLLMLTLASKDLSSIWPKAQVDQISSFVYVIIIALMQRVTNISSKLDTSIDKWKVEHLCWLMRLLSVQQRDDFIWVFLAHKGGKNMLEFIPGLGIDTILKVRKRKIPWCCPEWVQSQNLHLEQGCRKFSVVQNNFNKTPENKSQPNNKSMYIWQYPVSETFKG